MTPIVVDDSRRPLTVGEPAANRYGITVTRPRLRHPAAPMTRIARTSFPASLHHVTQRRNRRERIFFGDDDPLSRLARRILPQVRCRGLGAFAGRGRRAGQGAPRSRPRRLLRPPPQSRNRVIDGAIHDDKAHKEQNMYICRNWSYDWVLRSKAPGKVGGSRRLAGVRDDVVRGAEQRGGDLQKSSRPQLPDPFATRPAECLARKSLSKPLKRLKMGSSMTARDQCRGPRTSPATGSATMLGAASPQSRRLGSCLPARRKV